MDKTIKDERTEINRFKKIGKEVMKSKRLRYIKEIRKNLALLEGGYILNDMRLRDIWLSLSTIEEEVKSK